MKRTLVLLAACSSPTAPLAPSFQQDVMPVLAANCVRCHGYPYLGGAFTQFRLDSYSDVATVNPNDPTTERITFGVRTATELTFQDTNQPLIPFRIDSTEAPMPPRFPLDDYEHDVLINFVMSKERGAPRPDNRAPAVEVTVEPRAGAAISVTVIVRDPDDDIVAGELRARLPVKDRLLGPIRSGRTVLAWDVTTVAPGSYPLFARVDDGGEQSVIELGSIEVTP